MKKVIGYRLGVRVLKLALIILLMVILLSPSTYIVQPILAKDSSSSSSLTPIQQKLEDLKQEIASKAAQIKTEISQKISNKAYAGVISQIQDQPNASASAKLITIATARGNRTISTNDYTTFQDSTNPQKNITVKAFSQGDFIAALGDVDDNQVLTAKKIIKSKAPQATINEAVWGQIQSINSSGIFILNRDNKKVALFITSNTDFRVASDEAALNDVIPGNFLVSIGSEVQNNQSVSDFIYLINPNGKLKITREATSSATPSASPKKK